MDSRINTALEKHHQGYSCAQAIACTYADLVGQTEELMFKSCEGLGLGGGAMLGTCGALSGACVLAGFKSSTANLDHPNSKPNTMAYTRSMFEEFDSKVSSVICKDIKGVGTGKPLMSCDDCIALAARIVESTLAF